MSRRGHATPVASKLLQKRTLSSLDTRCDLQISSDKPVGARVSALQLSHSRRSRQSSVPRLVPRLVHNSAENMSTDHDTKPAPDVELVLPPMPRKCTLASNSPSQRRTGTPTIVGIKEQSILAGFEPLWGHKNKAKVDTYEGDVLTLSSPSQRRGICTTLTTSTIVGISERSMLAGIEPLRMPIQGHANEVQADTCEGNDTTQAASADQNDEESSERNTSLTDLLYQEIAEENVAIEDFLQSNLAPACEEESEMKQLKSSEFVERAHRACQSPYGEHSILVAPPDKKTLLKAAEFRGEHYNAL